MRWRIQGGNCVAVAAFAAIAATVVCGRASAQENATPLRFAWLSDTHVGSTTGDDDLRASVRDIDALGNVAFALVTGDITEMGSDEELARARADLDSLRTPLLLLPGNHDTKWSASGFTSFTRILGTERFVAIFGTVAFIGMHEGPIMRMGDGHFAPEDLRWLDSVTAVPSIREKGIIFCTHYPVDSSIDNWFEVTDRLNRLKTIAILCGHGHRNRPFLFEGIPGIMGRSNLRGGDTSGGYNIVELTGTTLAVREKRPGTPPGQPWGRIPVVEVVRQPAVSAWPRPSYDINKRYPGVRGRWNADRGWTITGGPCIADSTVVVGDRSGCVIGYSLATGATLWTVQVGGPICATPAAAGGRVVVASAGGGILCIDARSGTVIWKRATDKPIVSAPAISGGCVFVGTGSGEFYAMELNTGRPIWNTGGIPGFVETRPLVYDGRVYFGAWDCHFYAVDSADGSLVWKWSNGNPSRLYSPAACWAAGSFGRVFIVAPDRYMTAFDAATGRVVWRSDSHMVREAMGISEDGSRIYARSMRDTLFAFSATALAQVPLWQTVCGYGYDIDPSMCIEKDGTVYFGTKNGLVFAVDAGDGRIRWVRKIGETIVNTPAPLDGRRVVVTDFAGRVELLEGPE